MTHSTPSLVTSTAETMFEDSGRVSYCSMLPWSFSSKADWAIGPLLIQGRGPHTVPCSFHSAVYVAKKNDKAQAQLLPGGGAEEAVMHTHIDQSRTITAPTTCSLKLDSHSVSLPRVPSFHALAFLCPEQPCLLS